MSLVEKAMSAALQKREEQGALRHLSVQDSKIDFCSNDYIGFAHSEALYKRTVQKMEQLNKLNGSGGSRLLAGNSSYAEELESRLTRIHEAQAAIIFNSGYDANVGLFSSVPARGDTILYDELVHASIHDGIRLSRADSFSFRHNDIAHLQERLQHAKGNIFVAVESIYSMDGDSAPLKDLSEICNSNNASLIVDEAHATGVFGLGLTQQLKLQDKVFARVHTFGKAMGCHGAVILGSSVMIQYLINYARSFIYTTALPLHSLVTIDCAYTLLEHSKDVVVTLLDNIKHFREQASKVGGEWIESSSAIQSLIVPGNENVKKLAMALQAHNFDVRPIRSPTVAKGKERLRICLHSYNTFAQIDELMSRLKENKI
ncbi:MAG TPA: 8-amino-7-oxononanoate synthase [Bacteroidia bacterium]|jgi:8-amino-7-oxononanoate synthase|nr:8-amino-7-oxononanoate synthase [Bacteroidia bacterium]